MDDGDIDFSDALDPRLHYFIEEYRAGERDFRGIDLRGVSLRHAQLNHCDFTDASLQHTSWYGATLDKCNFGGAELRGASFHGSSFSSCSFDHAGMVASSLASTHVARTTFYRAWMFDSLWRDVDATQCHFDNARLDSATFDAVKLKDCTFWGTSLIRMAFVGTALDDLCCSTPSETTPVTVDWTSICLSLRAPTLATFLASCGMPDVFVTYSIECAKAHDPRGLFRMLRSTFISYGGPDLGFATKLQESLQRAGVRTFFFAKDAVPGKKLHHVMRDGISKFDRVVLVCSRASLDRPGVMNEIEQALAREARDAGETYIIPVTLDDYIFSWQPKRSGLAQEIRDRVVADFRGTERDPERYAEAVRRLLLALSEPMAS